MNHKVIKFERKQIMDFVFDKMWIQQCVRVNFFCSAIAVQKTKFVPAFRLYASLRHASLLQGIAAIGAKNHGIALL